MVSVIIPTYKRAQIISGTIQAVFNQTHSDIEVIVVYDGHCDETRQVVEAFSDKRLKYYEIEHSGRPAVPRNFGISKASGQYLAFCDDDDIWMPEKLELQMKKITEDDKIGLVHTQCLMQGKRGERIAFYNSKEGFVFKELFLEPFISNSTVLIKREVIDTVGLFDEDIRLRAVEDFDLWLRIAHKYKVGFIAKPVVVYRESNDNISCEDIFAKSRKRYLILWKFYKNGYVGLGLFIKKIFLVLGNNIFKIGHRRDAKIN